MARELVPEGDAEAVRRFARAFVDSGGSAKAAALAIGAVDSGAKAVGDRLVGRADVQAAIVQATRDKADVLAPMMLSVLARLALDSDVRPATRKDAALGVLAHSAVRGFQNASHEPVQDNAITVIATIQKARAERLGSQAIDITPKPSPVYLPIDQTTGRAGAAEGDDSDGS